MTTQFELRGEFKRPLTGLSDGSLAAGETTPSGTEELFPEAEGGAKRAADLLSNSRSFRKIPLD